VTFNPGMGTEDRPHGNKNESPGTARHANRAWMQ